MQRFVRKLWPHLSSYFHLMFLDYIDKNILVFHHISLSWFSSPKAFHSFKCISFDKMDYYFWLLKVLSFNDPSANCSPFIPDFLSGLWSAACCGLRSRVGARAGERGSGSERESWAESRGGRVGVPVPVSHLTPRPSVIMKKWRWHGSTWSRENALICPSFCIFQPPSLQFNKTPLLCYTQSSMSDLIASLSFWRQ